MDKDKAFILQILTERADVRYLDILNHSYFNKKLVLAKTLVNELKEETLLKSAEPGPLIPANNPHLKITSLGRTTLTSYKKYKSTNIHQWINTLIAGIALLLSFIALWL